MLDRHRAAKIALYYVAALAFAALAVGTISCKSLLVPEKTLSVELAGPALLDALEWGEASVQRDPELLPAERETALSSITLARTLVLEASK